MGAGEPTRLAVVSGGSGAIAQALLALLVAQPDLEVHALSRGAAPPELDGQRIHWHVSDYSDTALEALVAVLRDRVLPLEYLVICNGMLHGDGVFPERALRELDDAAMTQVFATNTLLPMRVLAAMTPLLRRAERPRVAALSARVGSIEDNQLGGWYSYRGSKAALNMMLRCAAIEFKRLNPRAKLMAFHPGTTDSALSKPFQARVPPDKLFTPEFVATRLWQLIETSVADGELAYLDWAGEPIPW